ncbi:MAG: polymer-forming cytoskeletal protein [Kofleriaceae bacterium]
MSDKNGLPTGKHTLVEEGTEFIGTLSSKCPIVVMGKVEGQVAGPVIHVTPSGVVAGKVKVVELRSAGEVAGEVEAEAVKISGKVRDKTVIRAKTLEVSLSTEKGGMEVLFGECELAVGDEPNKEAAIAAAVAPPAEAAKPEDPAEAAKADKTEERPAVAAPGGNGRRKGGEAPAAAAAETTDEEGAKRRRTGTQPPPA